jgi:putative photosynthetic complex assembly protein
MSDPFRNQTFPRAALVSAAALLFFTVGAAFTAHNVGFGKAAEPAATALVARDLQFLDQADGSVAVRDAVSGGDVAVLAPGSNVFIRGALRGFARARRAQDIGPQPAFRLTRWSDGRFTIADPATGRAIDLGAFGSTNAGSFAVLLQAAEQHDPSQAALEPQNLEPAP